MPGRAVSGVMLFGKLPAHGDFVSRGLSAVERSWWDERLSIGIARARAATGEAFDALCNGAPPWRFRLHPGKNAISGSVAVSIDRAGRRFPIVVARRDSSAAAACEAALLRGLREGLDADAVVALVGDGIDEDLPSLPAGWWCAAHDVDPLREVDPAAALPLMMAQHAGEETDG